MNSRPSRGEFVLSLTPLYITLNAPFIVNNDPASHPKKKWLFYTKIGRDSEIYIDGLPDYRMNESADVEELKSNSFLT